MALSGGVAHGYYLVPLQGAKNLPFGLTLWLPFLTSRIACPSAIHAQNDSPDGFLRSLLSPI